MCGWIDVQSVECVLLSGMVTEFLYYDYDGIVADVEYDSASEWRTERLYCTTSRNHLKFPSLLYMMFTQNYSV